MDPNDEHDNGKNTAAIPQRILSAVQHHIEQMPARPILEFLVKVFFAEVHWMSQLLHFPSFKDILDQWWTKPGSSSLTVDEVEFSVLLLRVCLLASQHLPSPSYAFDTIRGVALSQIRDTCCAVADGLASILSRLEPKGSLLRVQHICFNGLSFLCNGRAKEAWASFGSAIHIAEGLEHQVDATVSRSPLSPQCAKVAEEQQLMQRRALCNLYVWDSLLSRQLGRVPFMQNVFCARVLPSLHSLTDGGCLGDVPGDFDQRLLLFRLAKFWNNTAPQQHHSLGVYDPAVAEERYERFRKEFLAILPRPFALNSATDKEWSEKGHPRLPSQRLMLHVAMFESICHNFKPVLLLDPHQIRCLPAYKQDLALVHVQTLARAAVNVLDALSALHVLIGTSYTRCSDVIFQTFEAAVILVCIKIMRPDGLSSCAARQDTSEDNAVSRLRCDAALSESAEGEEGPKTSLLERCTQATQEASSRLAMLAEVSVTAEIGAYHLDRLIRRSMSSDARATATLAAEPPSTERARMGAFYDGSPTQVACSSGYTLAPGAPPASISEPDRAVNAIQSVLNTSFIPDWDNFDFACHGPFGGFNAGAAWSDDHPSRRGQSGQVATQPYMQ